MEFFRSHTLCGPEANLKSVRSEQTHLLSDSRIQLLWDKVAPIWIYTFLRLTELKYQTFSDFCHLEILEQRLKLLKARL